MNKLSGYLRLTRPANIVTAISDILAGVVIAAHGQVLPNLHFHESTSGFSVGYAVYDHQAILLLILSTIGLYGGGVVFNDVFDASLDKIERPERPIPSGLITKGSAARLGAVLLAAGILAATFVQPAKIFSISSLFAITIAIAALVYDKWGKHHPLLGPVNMGICRGLNLLLGMSVIPAMLNEYWFLGLVPVIYIGAITMISRGEVHGGRKSTMSAAVLFYMLVLLSILAVSIYNNTIMYAAGFLLLFAAFIFPPLIKAMKDPRGPLIGKAVKAGVISLIVMNASWAAAFGSLYFALIILLLLPFSLLLAKAFAVT